MIKWLSSMMIYESLLILLDNQVGIISADDSVIQLMTNKVIYLLTMMK